MYYFEWFDGNIVQENMNYETSYFTIKSKKNA